MSLHTILGAGGAVANFLEEELFKREQNVRLVSRSAKPRRPGNQVIQADLLEPVSANLAIKGSNYVYLVIGLQYDSQIWTEQWPVIMRNVISACRMYNAKLLFLDNTFLYEPLRIPYDEQSYVGPQGTKSKVRAQINDMLVEEINGASLDAMIVRSPDFFGPSTPKSLIKMIVTDEINKGKGPTWLMSGEFKHSLAYTPDIARAIVTLASQSDTWNQIWHLPSEPALTGADITAMASQVLGSSKPTRYISRGLIVFSGWFKPEIHEALEQLYQYDRPCIISDVKFRERFPEFKTTPLTEAFRALQEEYAELEK